MKREEVLLTEHRQLVELYNGHWTNIYYFGVSYVLSNGALFSVLWALWTFRAVFPPFYLTIFLSMILATSLIDYIAFVIVIRRKQVEMVSLINKAITIEETLQNALLPLDTFESCVAIFEKGKFSLIYYMASVLPTAWILGISLLLLYLGL